MSLKSIVKSFSHVFGYDIVKYYPDSTEIFLPPFDVMPFLLSAYIKGCLNKNPDFFFVSVGANDGISMDPLRESILTHHLRGILIEPLPDVFDELRENYKTEPQLLFENVAIGPKSGRMPIYRAKGPGKSLYTSFDRNILKSKLERGDVIEELFVETATISSLLDKHGIKKLDFLQVDAEGHDYEIVKSAIESGIRPLIINYEHCNITPTDATRCRRMLYGQGYKFTNIGIDTLCVRDDGA
jgi:FkbM family methyltransferase